MTAERAIEGTLSRKVAEALAEGIISGELGPGRKLDENSLAEKFKISRTPVRDALRELATTRLVEYFPRRGFTVAHIDPAKLDDMFEAAGEIEALCARLCALRSTATDRARIKSLHKQAHPAALQKNAQAYALLNEEFHLAIYAGTHNKTIEQVALNLRQRLAPFRLRMFFSADRVRTSHAEHDTIVEAIIKQEGDAAASAMRNHAARTAANVLQYFSTDRPTDVPKRRGRRENSRSSQVPRAEY